jgi:hypothetical protein
MSSRLLASPIDARIGFRHELDRTARVRREADDVVVARVECAKHVTARRVDCRRARARRRVLGMRVAEHAAEEQRSMRVDVRLGVERSAGVVEVRHAVRIEPRELALPQFGEERIGGRERMGQHPFPGRTIDGFRAAAAASGAGVRANAAAIPSTSAAIASQIRALRTIRTIRGRRSVPIMSAPRSARRQRSLRAP